jgi:hypothetical protein
MLEEIKNLEIEWNKTICIAGARTVTPLLHCNQGKTNLAQSLLLLNLAPKVDLVLLFGNPGSLTQWQFLVGPGMPHRIYPEVKSEVIETCFRVNGERLQKKQPPIRTLIIFDDSLSRATVHSDIINRVFIHGRIFHICPMVLQQSISQIHTDWRTGYRPAEMLTFGLYFVRGP